MSSLQKMEVIPVNDLDVALHNFVNKDDKLAFYSCVKYNLEETRVSISDIFFTAERILSRILFDSRFTE